MVTSVPFLIAKIADDSDFLRLKEMAYVHENWTLEYDKNSIKIWSKNVQDAAIKMVKVWSLFTSVSSIDVYNTLMDPIYRKEWDTHMILGFEIGHLNPNNVISYYAASCPPPVKSRDFVLQTSWLDRGSEHFIINHSVCHKDHPPKRSFIRAISYFTGYFIKGVPCNGCEMFFVSQTDPQGIIPAWIINKCTQIFAPKYVKQIEKAACAYGDWKSQNDPDFIPWVHPEQITSPKITISDCIPSDEELQSSFFKYLVEKNKTNGDIVNHTFPIRAKFSSPLVIPVQSSSEKELTSDQPNGTQISSNTTSTDASTSGREISEEKKSDCKVIQEIGGKLGSSKKWRFSEVDLPFTESQKSNY